MSIYADDLRHSCNVTRVTLDQLLNPPPVLCISGYLLGIIKPILEENFAALSGVSGAGSCDNARRTWTEVMMTEESPPPEDRYAPSGLNVAVKHFNEWPRMTCKQVPVSISHNRAVSSKDALQR